MESARGLQFSANISDGFLFSDVDFLHRFQAAKDAGFKGVESAFPVGISLDDLVSAQQAAGIEQVHLNLPAGDWPKGDRGLAADPGRVEEFRASVETGLKFALGLKCRRLHAMAGVMPEAADRAEWTKTYVANLRWAADLLAKNNIMLLIEPISSIPGYFLQHQHDGLQALGDVGHENVKLQFDTFHAQRKDGNLCYFLSENIKSVGHVQIGQVPGRHEPDSPGELNFSHLFSHIKSLGYDGWIGCEYKPSGDTKAGLSWLPSQE